MESFGFDSRVRIAQCMNLSCRPMAGTPPRFREIPGYSAASNQQDAYSSKGVEILRLADTSPDLVDPSTFDKMAAYRSSC
jgi:hypothetical protein